MNKRLLKNKTSRRGTVNRGKQLVIPPKTAPLIGATTSTSANSTPVGSSTRKETPGASTSRAPVQKTAVLQKTTPTTSGPHSRINASPTTSATRPVQNTTPGGSPMITFPTCLIGTPSSAGESSSNTPAVDHYAGIEVSYRRSKNPRISRKMKLPDEPLPERRLVLKKITKAGYFPTVNHKEAVHVTRVVVHTQKEGEKPVWTGKKGHSETKRKSMFETFQKYFIIDDKWFPEWSTRAGKVYRQYIFNRRKKLLEDPDLANEEEHSLLLYWNGEEYLKVAAKNKANRGKSPCGNTQHYLGSKGCMERIEEYRVKHGRCPTPEECMEMQFMKKVWVRVTDEEGETIEEEQIVYANPLMQERMPLISEEISSLSQASEGDGPPAPVSDLVQKQIIAKHIGFGKRGHVLGLGEGASEIAPPPAKRTKSSEIKELNASKAALEAMLSQHSQELENIKSIMDAEKIRLAEEREAERAALAKEREAMQAEMRAFMSQVNAAKANGTPQTSTGSIAPPAS